MFMVCFYFQLTGTPLLTYKRVQFNVNMRRVRKLELTKTLPTVLIPAIWVEEVIWKFPSIVTYFFYKKSRNNTLMNLHDQHVLLTTYKAYLYKFYIFLHLDIYLHAFIFYPPITTWANGRSRICYLTSHITEHPTIRVVFQPWRGLAPLGHFL